MRGWLLKDNSIEIIFLIVTSILLFIYFLSFNKTNMVEILSAILFISVFKKKISSDNTIHSNKNALYPFLITWLIPLILFIYQMLYGFPFTKLEGIYAILLIIFMVLTLLSSYLFGVKLSDYNWNISVKQLVMILIIFMGYISPRLILHGSESLRFYNEYNGNVTNYLIMSLVNFIQPALYEEVIYRGFLISALKGYDFTNLNANIVQSIIFGITHFSLYSQDGWIGILGLSAQILLGYILGKIYFESKSLTPCIIFHFLIDKI